MQIRIDGYRYDLLGDFFFGASGDFVAEIASSGITHIYYDNAETGLQVMVSGQGFEFDASGNPTGGTVSGMQFRMGSLGSYTRFGSISEVNWEITDFENALNAIATYGDYGPLATLFDGTLAPISYNVSYAANGYVVEGVLGDVLDAVTRPWNVITTDQYGIHIVNGGLVQVTPDAPLYLYDGISNSIEINGGSLLLQGALAEIIGGNFGDSFHGDAAIIRGMGGDDVFYNRGVESYGGQTATLTGRVYGGTGDDIFVDFYGSTEYYGGRDNDFFTNNYFTTHAQEGDVDAVYLGRGQDIAEFVFTSYSGPNGQYWEPRTAHLDGGQNEDLLILSTNQTRLYLTEERVLDFRDATNGTMQIQGVTFEGFESFSLRIGSRYVRELHVGDYDDTIIWVDNSNPRNRDLRLFGHRGDDFIIGSQDARTDYIYGGNGDDTLTGGGGSGTGWVDRIFGGRGDDLLLTNDISVGGAGTAIMRGGLGADTFVFSSAENGNVRGRVTDFTDGQDLIGLDMTSQYLLNDPEAHLRLASDLNITILRDTDAALRFVVEDLPGFYGGTRDLEFRYNRDTGNMHVNSTTGYGTDWNHIGSVIGAPDLTIDDFVFYTF